MNTRPLSTLGVVLVLALLWGCDRAATPPSASATSAPDAAPTTAPETSTTDTASSEGLQEVISNDETYVVRYRFLPASIPLNEPFGIEAWIADRDDPDAPLDDIALQIDGRMPNHKHGMNREPSIKRGDDGAYAIDGMLFHMPGFWEIHFDVTRGAVTERAQLEVQLR